MRRWEDEKMRENMMGGYEYIYLNNQNGDH